MKNPPHPGDLIRTEIVEAFGLNVSKAAEILKVRRPAHREGVRPGDGPPSPHALACDVAKTREHARDIPIKQYVRA
jgi:hypothetical protein